MGRGIAIGLLIASAGFGVYYAMQNWDSWFGEPTGAGPESVDQLKAEIYADPTRRAQLEAAAVNPRSAISFARPENYPAFLAYLDFGPQVSQVSVDDYRLIFSKVAGYYGNDTPTQVLEGVFSIHDAQIYYPTLTYRESLEHLQDTLPPTFDPATSGARSSKSVRQASEDIHNYLVAAHFQPQWDAMQAQQEHKEQIQQRINQNIAAAKASGAAANAARAQALAAHNARVNRNMNYYYNDYQSYNVNSGLNTLYRRY